MGIFNYLLVGSGGRGVWLVEIIEGWIISTGVGYQSEHLILMDHQLFHTNFLKKKRRQDKI